MKYLDKDKEGAALLPLHKLILAHLINSSKSKRYFHDLHDFNTMCVSRLRCVFFQLPQILRCRNNFQLFSTSFVNISKML